MSVTFTCPQCGKEMSAPDALAGKQGACPRCGLALWIPELEEEPLETPHANEPASDHPSLLVRSHAGHGEDLVDMTAMVDIVFFLLIFFLVTSMQALEAVIDLPAAQASETAGSGVTTAPDYASDANFVEITIDADDTVWVEDVEALSEQDLRIKLREIRDEDDSRTGLLVNGAADATHGTFVMVIDAGRDAGMTDLMFSVSEGEDDGE